MRGNGEICIFANAKLLWL